MNNKIKYMSLAEASNYINSITGIYVPKKTLYFWSREGKATPYGQKVKLKVRKKFGKMWTKKEWLEDFLYEIG